MDTGNDVMIRKVMFLVLCCLLMFTAAAFTAAQAESCPGALPSQLVVGEQAIVTPGSANNLRAEPTTSGERIGQITAGTVVNVLDGPVCADNFTWWQVETLDGSLTGWTVEAVENDYALVPANFIAQDGVQFAVDAPLSEMEIVGETLTPILPGPDVPMYALSPAYIRFTFENGGEMQVYTVDAFSRMDSLFAEQLAAFNRVIAERPTLTQNALNYVSFLRGAVQVFAGRGEYVETEQLIGVRWLATTAQMDAPIYQSNVVYQFRAVTRDGRHYVRFSMPLFIEALPPVEETTDIMMGYTWDESGDAYREYIAAVTAEIEAMSPENFAPRLEVLDALVESITIAPDTLEEFDAAVAEAFPPIEPVSVYESGACDVADFPSRLTKGGIARAVYDMSGYEAPGGFTAGWVIDAGVEVSLLDGPFCEAGTTYWLVYWPEREATAWMEEIGERYNQEGLFYKLEPVSGRATADALPPVLTGQQVSDCVLIPLGRTSAYLEPNLYAERAGEVLSGATYYADAVLLYGAGWWRLTPGATGRVNRQTAALPDPVWVAAYEVYASPECAHVEVIETAP